MTNAAEKRLNWFSCFKFNVFANRDLNKINNNKKSAHSANEFFFQVIVLLWNLLKID